MASKARIRPWDGNPSYWSYQGKPVLLRGGTIEHNLFQIPDLREHLDLLVSCGGNYVRNTMSGRPPLKEETWRAIEPYGLAWPFEFAAHELRYDLDRPNPEYWRRFENLLKLTHERGIIVQIELWDRFDFYREQWLDNPFNPKNNVTYSSAESGLVEDYPMHPGENKNPFFSSVPDADDNRVLLPHQQRLVDWLLSASLEYDHVLYCIDNETNGIPEWGWYWARYIRDAAERAGVEVETTEMWWPPDLSDVQHSHTLDHPDVYTFVEVSQNSAQSGQRHWDQLQQMRERIIASGRKCPMNNVKIYGADSSVRDWTGNDRDGAERFWRNIFGGCASARFHRPPSGLGLGPIAQSHLKSARRFADTVPIWDAEPRNDLLRDRSDNHAYCLVQPGSFLAVFLPDGGRIACDVSSLQESDMTLTWLDINVGEWSEPSHQVANAGQIDLHAPDRGFWIGLVRSAANSSVRL